MEKLLFYVCFKNTTLDIYFHVYIKKNVSLTLIHHIKIKGKEYSIFKTSETSSCEL
jgi:hypothetical protein